MIEIHHTDNLDFLRSAPPASFDLIYIDPPFNTGKAQARTRTTVRRADPNDAAPDTPNGDTPGDRTGFQGRRYTTQPLGTIAYEDTFDDYLPFLAPRLEAALHVLAPTGSLFVHLDYREVHYVKVLLDRLFGRDCFQNEIIWAYDYGGRPKRRWPAKHDTILWYTCSPSRYTYNYDAIDRIPYLAPGLVTPEKAARGKTPTDVWWHTIVSPTGKEKTGYPTQKPLGILSRIVNVHSNPGDRLLDYFAGSGSFGEAAARNDRRATLVDNHAEAIRVMCERFRAAKIPFTVAEPTSD